ncbi:MAG: cryptochrome/photolyase family protein [Acidobacteriota bacterium]
MTAPALVWFRDDLRLADHPALVAAARSGRPVIAAYVFDDETERPLGGAARWWLAGSLEALAADLAALGVPLVLRRGRADKAVRALVRESGAATVHWNRRYRQAAAALDDALAATLGRGGIAVEVHAGDLLFEPAAIRSGSGAPYRVFAPFWRACLAASPPAPPLPRPRRIAASSDYPTSERLGDWQLRPSAPDWAAGLRATWTPGEHAARRRLQRFVRHALADYALRRDFPAKAVTSGLSPHLRWGEVSPRQIWHAVHAEDGRSGAAFLRELGWREFAAHALWHVPNLATTPLRPEFAHFRWRRDVRALRAWQRGRTGYPLVDAGMRELWATGAMHNRVRMAAASFLVKHLLLPWQAGEAWFWDTLVDADPASNAMNWQWVAGCGIDAAPYFRIFNPVLQGRKFDPEGEYVRRWVPELRKLSVRDVHAPWLASTPSASGYPPPIVEHAAARRRALAALSRSRQKR